MLFQFIRIYIFNFFGWEEIIFILKMETSTYLGACLKFFLIKNYDGPIKAFHCEKKLSFEMHPPTNQ